MTEDGRGRKSLKDLVSDAVEQELAQYPKRTLTPQQLEAMVLREAQRKRRKRRRIAGIAAVFVIAAIGIGLALDAPQLGAEADKPESREVVSEDGIIVENSNWGGSPEDILTIDNLEDIEIAKKWMPELLLPTYIPQQYSFKELEVERVGEGCFTAIYKYNKGNSQDAIEALRIEEIKQTVSLSQNIVEQNSSKWDCQKGEFYISNDGTTSKTATIILHDGFTVVIQGNLSYKEFVRIIDGLV